MIAKFLLKYYFRSPSDFVVPLGTKMQKGSLFAVVYSNLLWKDETFFNKLKSILTRKWSPSQEVLADTATNVLLSDVFGLKDDFGEVMFNLMIWHNSQDWQLDHLLDDDKEKSVSLDSFTALTRTKFKNLHYNHLRLFLAKRTPWISMLVVPMLAKIPIVSIRYYVDIHYEFAANSIRKSKHSLQSDLVSYLYEIVFLQQKISISLHEYIRLASFTQENKKNALLINAEVDAIREADNTVSYLKASMEKIISLIALTHNITKLDKKKTHQAKLNVLDAQLPKKVLSLYYWQFIRDFISTDNLNKLNNYRTGIMHKKGISKLQPHHYAGKTHKELPFEEIFSFLQEQHAKNSAVLLASLAILTDDLVNRDIPSAEWQAEYFRFNSIIAEQIASFLPGPPEEQSAKDDTAP